jgi:nucleoside-diphosphate-sugar epimerase
VTPTPDIAAPRALVSGSGGFIGRRLVRDLVDRGWTVHVIVRSSSARTTGDEPVVVHVDDGVTPLHSVVAASAPDVCFHLAGRFAGNHVDDDVIPLVIDNVLFGTRLADALASRGDCLMVNAGSFWQNAGGGAYHPVELYAATKQALQDVLQYYVEAGQLKVVTLKFFETFGPNDVRPKLVNLLLKAAATGEPIQLSPGDQYVDLVHVDDASNACLVAATLGAPSGSPLSFAVSSGSPIRVKDLVARLSDVIGRDVPVVWGERGYRWREMMEPWDVAPRLPQWSPRVSLDEGLRSMWAGLALADTAPDEKL